MPLSHFTYLRQTLITEQSSSIAKQSTAIFIHVSVSRPRWRFCVCYIIWKYIIDMYWPVLTCASNQLHQKTGKTKVEFLLRRANLRSNRAMIFHFFHLKFSFFKTFWKCFIQIVKMKRLPFKIKEQKHAPQISSF